MVVIEMANEDKINNFLDHGQNTATDTWDRLAQKDESFLRISIIIVLHIVFENITLQTLTHLEEIIKLGVIQISSVFFIIVFIII